MKHVIIINPIAGVKNQLEKVRVKAIEAFNGVDYTIYVTKEIGDATKFTKKYLEENPSEEVRFYACGGDGTLNEVVNGMVNNPNASITNYPIGSGNDFLKYFGKADDFLDFKRLINGKVIKTDLIKFDNHYVVNIFNIGLDANVVVYQRKFKKLPLISGKGAYNLGVIFSLLNRISHHFLIKVDDEIMYDDKVTLCAVANAKCYGGGYYCAPKAAVDDGIIDVCLVKKVSRLTFASLVKIYKAGKHLEDPKVIPYIMYKQGKKVEITIEKPLYYSIDGEIGKADHLVLEVVNKALNFVVPVFDN